MTNKEDPRSGPVSGEEDFAALFAASEAQAAPRPKIEAGDLVRGRVVAIGAMTAFVEIGGKGEAIIDLNDFRDPQTGALGLAVGDYVEATATDDGSRSGSIVLKRALGRGGHVPGELEQALAHGIPVEGVVTGENKGGFDIQIGNVRAFCPASQIDRRRGEPAQYIGQRLQFRVTKIESGGRNIVVSRRQLLEVEDAIQAESTWERVQVGAVLQGKVTSIRDFGAFVDLGGVEGLIHVSELAHGRAEHPSAVLTEGQQVDVKVLKVEASAPGGRTRVALSMRALAPDPWTTARERFAVGSTVSGKVRRLEGFGAFVEIAPGLDGLVHVSKLALDRRIAHPRQVVAVGDEVSVTVMSVDPEQRRIALSMVETARREQEASTQAARRDEQTAVSQLNEARAFGSFAQLLAASKKEPE